MAETRADVESVRFRSVGSIPSQNNLFCKNGQSVLKIPTPAGAAPGKETASDFHEHENTEFLARPAVAWLIILILHVILVCFIELRNGSYPEPLSDIKASTDIFSEERARIYLSGLTNIGSRIVGSVANERTTVEYILNEINKINKNSNSELHALEVDLQNAKGSFDLNFLGGFTNVYENIKNIVVRIGSAKKQLKNSLLINCHYDTFILTPGASDDAVSCAIMLEVLGVLSQQKQEMENSIIFLFNGAEENILQGSHAFVTSHPWFKQVRAFINLEAAGAGGKELFFQAAPNHLWLLNFYATHVPHPYASSIAQEIFQSGAVQSDTDFRIFRDFGHLPGIDIAYIRNGFFYHTKHDTPDKIPPGCIQRGGDNLLSLAKGLGQAPDLYVLMSVQQTEYVFFDLFGYFLIYFEANYLFVLNIITSLFVCGTLFKDIFRERKQSIGLWQFSFATGSIVCSWLAGLLFSTVAALMMDFIGCVMTWFTTNWLLIGLYTSPSLVASVLVMRKLKQQWLKEKMSACQMQDVMSQTTMIIISSVLFWLSWKRVASSFPLLLLLISLLFKFYVVKYFELLQKKAVVKFLILHWTFMIPITMLNLYCASAIITTFIPLMGRAGASIPSDLIMAVMVSLATSYFLLYHLHLLFLVGNFKIHFAFLFFTFFFSFFLSTCTRFGFPFSSDSSYPISQRIFLQHVNRKFHESNNRTIEDSSLMFVPLDRTSLSHLLPIKQLNISSFQPLPCSPHPYCGWAYFLPLITHMDQVFYLPVPRHKVLPEVDVKFHAVEKLSGSRRRFLVKYSGPERMTIYITPCNNTKLKEWNVGSKIPIPTMMPQVINDKPHYFIFTSFGVQPSLPQQLVVTVEYGSDWSEGQCSLQIAVAGHYFSMDERPWLSSSLSFYLQHFPSWTSTIYSASTYESWTL